jgi:V/A-type H+-transporting ATPase subunit G/H
MNEKHIQQVLEIEKQAQEVQEQARREAQEIPAKAEQEAQALIAKAKADAHEEARKMLAAAQPKDMSSSAGQEGESVNSEFEAAAKKNFNKAVTFVLERVIGRA